MAPLGEEIQSLDVAIAEFKAALERARTAKDHLRAVMHAGGWLEEE